MAKTIILSDIERTEYTDKPSGPRRDGQVRTSDGNNEVWEDPATLRNDIVTDKLNQEVIIDQNGNIISSNEEYLSPLTDTNVSAVEASQLSTNALILDNTEEYLQAEFVPGTIMTPSQDFSVNSGPLGIDARVQFNFTGQSTTSHSFAAYSGLAGPVGSGALFHLVTDSTPTGVINTVLSISRGNVAQGVVAQHSTNLFIFGGQGVDLEETTANVIDAINAIPVTGTPLQADNFGSTTTAAAIFRNCFAERVTIGGPGIRLTALTPGATTIAPVNAGGFPSMANYFDVREGTDTPMELFQANRVYIRFDTNNGWNFYQRDGFILSGGDI